MSENRDTNYTARKVIAVPDIQARHPFDTFVVAYLNLPKSVSIHQVIIPKFSGIKRSKRFVKEKFQVIIQGVEPIVHGVKLFKIRIHSSIHIQLQTHIS